MSYSRRLAAVLVLMAVMPMGMASSAEKEDPAKFKYRDIPVTATCLEGYHPTVDPQWGNVFPCIKDAEIVAPVKNPTAVKAEVRPAG